MKAGGLLEDATKPASSQAARSHVGQLETEFTVSDSTLDLVVMSSLILILYCNIQ